MERDMVNSRVPNGLWNQWKKLRSRDCNLSIREAQARTACPSLRCAAHDGETFKFLSSPERLPSRYHVVNWSRLIVHKVPTALFFSTIFQKWSLGNTFFRKQESL